MCKYKTNQIHTRKSERNQTSSVQNPADYKDEQGIDFTGKGTWNLIVED
jgi:hypothetical protein